MDPYFDDPNYAITTASTRDVPEQQCSDLSWLWIILLIIALLAIVALVIWVIWLYHTRDNNTKEKLELTNARISVSTGTSITGTWEKTSNSDDIVTLYATLDPPIYDTEGKVTNSVKSATAGTGSTSVQVSGLQSFLKYYATLVVTNKKTTSFHTYNQLVYMDAITPLGATGATGAIGPTFSIQDILQVGKLELKSEIGSSGQYDVNFSKNPSEENSLWYMTPDSKIKLDETKSGLDDLCLFNSGGKLIAQSCGATGASSEAIWVYNPSVKGSTGVSYANQWCLNNTTQNDTPTCMVLGTISAGIDGQALVTLSDKTTAGNAWVNAYESR